MKEAKEKSSFTSLERLFITKTLKVLIEMRVRDLIAKVIQLLEQIYYECEKTYSYLENNRLIVWIRDGNSKRTSTIPTTSKGLPECPCKSTRRDAHIHQLLVKVQEEMQRAFGYIPRRRRSDTM